MEGTPDFVSQLCAGTLEILLICQKVGRNQISKTPPKLAIFDTFQFCLNLTTHINVFLYAHKNASSFCIEIAICF